MDRSEFIRAHTRPLPVPSVPEITLCQADEATTLWAMTERDLADSTLAPPFWAFPWAGGQALARYLLDHPHIAEGRTVFDLASGSGLVAIAAAMAGARHVTACDIDPFAAEAALINAELNGVALTPLTADLLDGPPPQADLLLAGDIGYEKPMAERILDFLRRAKAAGAEVLLGDPGRRYFPGDLTEVAVYHLDTHPDLEDAAVRTARVWRL